MPDQPAGWFVIYPCGTTCWMCDGWASLAQSIPPHCTVACPGCDAGLHPVTEVIFDRIT